MTNENAEELVRKAKETNGDFDGGALDRALGQASP